MKRGLAITFLATAFALCPPSAISAAAAGTPDAIDVFVGGRGGYHTYRIPAILARGTQTVLAFCEGRRNGPADDGDIDLLLRRSADGGNAWFAPQVVHAEKGPVTIGNPCPLPGTREDTVHLLFTRNNRRLFYARSDDAGRTWTPPAEQTAVLKGFDYPLVRIGTGPVHGIRLDSGRLVAPVWVSDRLRKNKNKNPTRDRFRSGIIYSDDAGSTWKTGGLVAPAINRLNECTVLQRRDGSLLLNMRAHGAGFRATATSGDGGKTWSRPVLDPSLPCPTCQASMIRLAGREALFCNPAVSKKGGFHARSRRNLTLRLSTDDGRTWSRGRTIHAGPAGYADLGVTADGTILCLFENGTKVYREKISLAAVDRAWLADGD